MELNNYNIHIVSRAKKVHVNVVQFNDTYSEPLSIPLKKQKQKRDRIGVFLARSVVFCFGISLHLKPLDCAQWIPTDKAELSIPHQCEKQKSTKEQQPASTSQKTSWQEDTLGQPSDTLVYSLLVSHMAQEILIIALSLSLSFFTPIRSAEHWFASLSALHRAIGAQDTHQVRSSPSSFLWYYWFLFLIKSLFLASVLLRRRRRFFEDCARGLIVSSPYRNRMTFAWLGKAPLFVQSFQYPWHPIRVR